MAKQPELPQVRRVRLGGLALIVAGVAVSFVGALVMDVPAVDWAGRATFWTGIAVLVGGALHERRFRVQTQEQDAERLVSDTERQRAI